MPEINRERVTAKIDQPFVVFLIGMRVNRFFSFSSWFPVAMAMPKMLQVLYQHPEKGFLGGESFFRFSPVTTLLLSYWRSFEDLERFARSKDDPHLEPWRKFNQIAHEGKVGIWHETYMVEPGKYEVLYRNMPPFGLGSATSIVPIGKYSEEARQRVEGVRA